jgi:hypothetical protein
MPSTSAQRVAAYRKRQREKGEPDSSRANSREHREGAKIDALFRLPAYKPFIGCDGEGAGVDSLGRQNYLLFRCGEDELFTGAPLTTHEILSFLCDCDADGIYVGFAFGYDVTMILRDVPASQQAKLFAPKEFGPGKSRFVWYREFDIEYLPKQYFRVRKVKVVRNEQGEESRVPSKGSTRTIFETFGFFQQSFVKAISAFSCGTESERASIAASKARRAEFSEIAQEEREYCALECRLLSELMSKLREYCYAAGIKPKQWSGAGKLASAMHAKYGTQTKPEPTESLPQGVLDYAQMAYYGGRFEITRTGLIGSTVHEYDIRSAFPDAMRQLPCLLHGSWVPFEKNACPREGGSTYIAAVTFNHPDQGPGQLCGMPVRSKTGHLYWPLQGSGIYWSCEIEAAKALGANVTVKGGWIYRSNCDCELFGWVEQQYDYRRSIGSSGPGYPIKLGINALYGKLAQRKGNGKYTNMIHAGLITARTRAKLMHAIAQAPGDIVMVATDAVYSLPPLALPVGERLGEWEYQELSDLFIVQPGLYWSPDRRKRKSRGLSSKFFEEAGRTEEFERRWNSWCQTGGEFPSVDVDVTNFIGLKLALTRGKPETAGVWKNEVRSISFDYSNKRDGHIYRDGHIVTNPKPGSPFLKSLPHSDFLKSGGQEPWENARLMFDEME